MKLLSNINPVKDTFLIDTIFKQYESIGIIINNVNSNQAAIEFLHEGYVFLDQQSQTELVFFTETWEFPILAPPTGVYHVKHLMGYSGHIITTSVDGIIDALRIGTIQNILWYIYSPAELLKYNRDMINGLLGDDRVIKVCRSESHKKIIQSQYANANIFNENLPYPNIERLYNIVSTYDQKN